MVGSPLFILSVKKQTYKVAVILIKEFNPNIKNIEWYNKRILIVTS